MTATQPVLEPVFEVWRAGRNVTRRITPYVTSITYTDYVEGQADTLEIALEDSDGRWRDADYPVKGENLSLELGYADQPRLECGVFEIDELELDGPPDVVQLRAIAAGVLRPQRTHLGRAYENTTLAGIAQKVATRLHLKLVGKIDPVAIRRVTQIHENDLTFLHRLADEYGYAFNVKGTQLVFWKRRALRDQSPILTLTRGDLTRYNLRDKIMGVVEETRIAYHDPKTKRLRHYKVRDTARAGSGKASSDVVKHVVRTESPEQAETKASAALDAANIEATVLNCELIGNLRMVAGVNFTLRDMGRVSGVYHIVSSRHTMSRSSGYSTSIEAKRVR
jgi:phage protein D